MNLTHPLPPPPGILTAQYKLRPKLVLQQKHTLHVQLDMSDLMVHMGKMRCMAIEAR